MNHISNQPKENKTITNNVWNDFINQYDISKTLRFELKPIGKTLEKIGNNKNQLGLNSIDEDDKRAREYKIMKKIIDEYHKHFIEIALGKVNFDKDDLEEFSTIYNDLKSKNNKNNQKEIDKLKKKFSELQKKFRKKIHQQIKPVENFEHLFKKELIQKILIEWLEKKDSFELVFEEEKINQARALELTKKFRKWVTYFKGFNANRKNVYSVEDIPTSIIYRIVHDNLEKFLANVSKYHKLKENYFKEGLSFEKINEALKEELEGRTLAEVFSLEYFNQCLNQTGIDRFNIIIGGKFVEGEKEKRQGVNEYINLFSQQFKKTDKAKSKNILSLKMVELFKQILSDRKSGSFQIDKIKDDQECINGINNFYKALLEEKGEDKKNIFEKTKELFTRLGEFKLEEIYLKNETSLTAISQSIFSDYNFINRALENYAKVEKFPWAKKDSPTKKEKKTIEDWLKKTAYFSIAEVQDAINRYLFSEYVDKKIRDEYASKNLIVQEFSKLEVVNQGSRERKNLLEKIKEKYGEVEQILNKEYENNSKELLKKTEAVEKVKSFLDAILDLFHFIKPFDFNLKKKKAKGEETELGAYEKDGSFYSEFELIFQEIKGVIQLYNQVRNYVTQKPYSLEKFKLNFENSTLAAGWDKNKEKDNTSIILKKDSLFYLGIINEKHKKIFEDIKEGESNDFYEKMEYKQIAKPSNDLHTIFDVGEGKIQRFTKKLDQIRENYLPADILEIKRKETYKKENFIKSDLVKFIDYYKEISKQYWKWCDFSSLKKSADYQNINEFTNDLKLCGYKINFKKVDSGYIDDLVDEGKLYLFQIYSKDFSKCSKGKKNLHTLYWQNLFSNENLKNIVLKLNGEAELFYRRASIPAAEKIIHKKEKKIENKDPINNKKESIFNYDLIKDRRFTKDKFLFHCSITINFKVKGNKYLNPKVIQTIKNNRDKINILSIDRGERNLAYWTLLNPKREIIKQGTFNIIKDIYARKIDYQKKLNQKEIERGEARKSWKTIENIKELKEGYLSQVVHEISKLVVEHKAILVFEDLNFGFKKGRFKIEKQVYQKFEKMLIDKLNYLSFKSWDKNQIGGILKGYQLTNKFESFQKLGKQSGIIFYVPAGYTSKICPKTGFVNLFYPKYDSKKKYEDFIKGFYKIFFNKEKNYFEFHFNYGEFNEIKNSFSKEWKVCSFGKRLINCIDEDNNHQWVTKEIDITDEIKKFFFKKKINFQEGANLMDDIRQKLDSKNAFEKFAKLLRHVMQMRNLEIGSEKDYFLSCVADERGNFFDTREEGKKELSNLPHNGDANGAYNIGIKGIMVIDKIIDEVEKGTPLNNIKWKITNSEFFEFVNQKKD